LFLALKFSDIELAKRVLAKRVLKVVDYIVKDEFNASQELLQEHAKENTTCGTWIEGDYQ
jgi:hypothetical protein